MTHGHSAELQRQASAPDRAQPLTLIEQDAESVTFKTVLQTDKSTWTQYLRLFRRDGAIEVENQVDWQEKHVLAKVLFDCNVLARQALCDTSAGLYCQGHPPQYHLAAGSL